MTVLLIAAGAALGAPLRYLVDRLLDFHRRLPWGTLAVNVSGSFLLGLLTAAHADPGRAALLGAGFCGGLTTYSTFSYETLQLFEQNFPVRAWLNIGANLVLGGVAVVLGWWLGS